MSSFHIKKTLIRDKEKFLFTEECQLINVEEWQKKKSFTAIIIINLSKNHQLILKPWVNACLRIEYSYSLKALPHR